ncbi:hypothetical protein IP90_00957 [Luteimonas cucumeris]|uniref:Uncharacterized protein n=1 Tax=Luteimonas cucumeris TaxID=985012 RepID=A0A562LAX0_9GAMM|nr:hypothetical protein [Luteimonas cucumeris]TWI04819.1 hypothetical protein IP90_00957 [Luteimonas cucumeris]
MTTIAYKSGVLCADSMAVDDSGAVFVRKAAWLPGGDAAGGAGDLNQVTAALAWLAGGGKGDAPDIGNSCILFTDQGQPYMASTGWPGAPIKGYCAIGSGAQGAMVAMKLGLSAHDAIAAVSGIDTNTGGEIDVFEIGKRAKPARKRAAK